MTQPLITPDRILRSSRQNSTAFRSPTNPWKCLCEPEGPDRGSLDVLEATSHLASPSTKCSNEAGKRPVQIAVHKMAAISECFTLLLTTSRFDFANSSIFSQAESSGDRIRQFSVRKRFQKARGCCRGAET
jgi:hypothetical protein